MSARHAIANLREVQPAAAPCKGAATKLRPRTRKSARIHAALRDRPRRRRRIAQFVERIYSFLLNSLRLSPSPDGLIDGREFHSPGPTLTRPGHQPVPGV